MGTASADGFPLLIAPRAGESHRECLRSRRWMIGTVASSPDPILAESLGREFDFVWIDLEHSALTVRDVQTLVIAVQGAGAHALVRLPRFDSEVLSAVLDCGPDGIVAPKVASAAAAKQLVRSLRFPPQGERGFAPRRASVGRASALDLREQQPGACLIQIETREALEGIDGILECEGVDAVVVGTADLSLDLGDPLNLESPELIAAVEGVAAAASRRGVPWGFAAGELVPWVRRSAEDGATVLTYSSDARIYASAVGECSASLRALAPAAGLPSGEEHA